MRSHLAKFPLPAPKPQPQPNSPQSPATHRSANSELSFVAISDPIPMVLDDRESDTESRRITVNSDKASLRPKQSKRSRQSADGAEHASPLSSKIALSDEGAARCLLLLSVDNNSRVSAVKKAAASEVMDETRSDEEEDEGRDGSFCMKLEKTRARFKFRCEECKKVFGSYQALGGHKASHSHGKSLRDTQGINHQLQGSDNTNTVKANDQCDLTKINRRIFECPFCDKVFESGQGLGGHKKVHLFNAAEKKRRRRRSDNDCDDSDTAKKKCIGAGRLFIDLNLPEAPHDPSR